MPNIDAAMAGESLTPPEGQPVNIDAAMAGESLGKEQPLKISQAAIEGTDGSATVKDERKGTKNKAK